MTSAVSNAWDWLGGVVDLVRMDLVQFFRNRLVVVATLLTSVSMILSFGLGSARMPGFAGSGDNYFAFIFPGILGVGIMFSCTYTIGYAVIVDRQRRTIEDIVLSPLSFAGFVVGRLVGMVLKCALQFVVSMALALALFDVDVASYPLLAYGMLTQSLAFAGLGILVATFTTEVSFSLLTNVVIVPLTYFCGVFFPLESFGRLGPVVARLPLSVNIDVLRDAMTGQPSRFIHGSLWLSAVYALVAVVGAMAVFRHRVQKG
ncbi:ABC transporter permease [Myxococcus sp. K15C18031901]|uniref:ABC transporter permease n=1 Tax=Myxococcus dinghuensis TaxID=2906761 RepID=UPI0020A74CB1|nr:ABC transporter permease [Myxococcus dinghuensis]MCP3098092.1 ABC transporter permease [Myxococcus dinghuensis]